MPQAAGPEFVAGLTGTSNAPTRASLLSLGLSATGELYSTFQPEGLAQQLSGDHYSALKGFDGRWKRQSGSSEDIVISGGCVDWGDGPKTSLELVSSNQVKMLFSGTVLFGTLRQDSELHWSDGDVWTKVDYFWMQLKAVKEEIKSLASVVLTVRDDFNALRLASERFEVHNAEASRQLRFDMEQQVAKLDISAASSAAASSVASQIAQRLEERAAIYEDRSSEASAATKETLENMHHLQRDLVGLKKQVDTEFRSLREKYTSLNKSHIDLRCIVSDTQTKTDSAIRSVDAHSKATEADLRGLLETAFAQNADLGARFTACMCRLDKLDPPESPLKAAARNIELRGNIRLNAETGRVAILRGLDFQQVKQRGGNKDEPLPLFQDPVAAAAVCKDLAELSNIFGCDAMVEVHTRGGDGEFWQSVAKQRARIVTEGMVKFGANSTLLRARGSPSRLGKNERAEVHLDISKVEDWNPTVQEIQRRLSSVSTMLSDDAHAIDWDFFASSVPACPPIPKGRRTVGQSSPRRPMSAMA